MKSCVSGKRTITGKRERDLLLEAGYRPGPVTTMNEATKTGLTNRYAVDLQRLSALTGIDFKGWHDRERSSAEYE